MDRKLERSGSNINLLKLLIQILQNLLKQRFLEEQIILKYLILLPDY